MEVYNYLWCPNWENDSNSILLSDISRKLAYLLPYSSSTSTHTSKDAIFTHVTDMQTFVVVSRAQNSKIFLVRGFNVI